jgi:folate-binding protein YgfZ
MTETFEDEYRALHAAAVWADRSARDVRVDVHGPDATAWLQGLLTQDVAALQPGEGAYAAYLTPQGRMVADLRVLRRDDGFLLEAVATVRPTLLSRLDQFVIMEDVTITDVTDTFGVLTVIGPHAAAVTSAVTGLAAEALEALPEHGHLPAATPGSMVAASRAFGASGFDLFASAAQITEWRARLQGQAPEVGEELLETARIEAGRPRFGVDMHEDTIPLEAGIESRAISFDKGCYVGQEVVIRILHRGQGRVAKRLVWVEQASAAERDPAWKPGTPVMFADKVVGSVSSACWSPARVGRLGLAMLHRDATEPGTIVTIAGSEAVVRRLP